MPKLAYALVSRSLWLRYMHSLFATRAPCSSDFEENNWLLIAVYDFLKREQISDIPSFQDDHSQN